MRKIFTVCALCFGVLGTLFTSNAMQIEERAEGMPPAEQVVEMGLQGIAGAPVRMMIRDVPVNLDVHRRLLSQVYGMDNIPDQCIRVMTSGMLVNDFINFADGVFGADQRNEYITVVRNGDECPIQLQGNANDYVAPVAVDRIGFMMAYFRLLCGENIAAGAGNGDIQPVNPHVPFCLHSITIERFFNVLDRLQPHEEIIIANEQYFRTNNIAFVRINY